MAFCVSGEAVAVKAINGTFVKALKQPSLSKAGLKSLPLCGQYFITHYLKILSTNQSVMQ